MDIPNEYNDIKALASENGYKGKQDKKSLIEFLSNLEPKSEDTVVVEGEFTLNQNVLFPEGLRVKGTKITAEEANKMPKQWYS